MWDRSCRKPKKRQTPVKNRNFYLQKLSEYSEFYNVELHLFYGAEFFTFLGQPNLWDDLIDWLQQWKAALPELPEINFDSTPEASFQEIKGLENRTWRKLITNNILWDQAIMSALFKEGNTLSLLLEHFRRENTSSYPQLAKDLSLRLQKYYPGK